jgi:hypothetical protein
MSEMAMAVTKIPILITNSSSHLQYRAKKFKHNICHEKTSNLKELQTMFH